MVRKSDKQKGFVPRKKRGGSNHDDDESVDSRGNIRGLIDYDYDSEEDSAEFTQESSSSGKTPKSPIARRTRNALKKNKTVRRGSSSDESSESDREYSMRREYLELEEENRRVRQRQRKLKDRLHKLRRKRDEEEEPRRRKRRQEESEEESEEEDEEETEDEDEEEEDGTVEEESEEDEEDDEDDSSEESGRFHGITLSFGGGDENDRMIPKRHNMKKESAEVKKFVKLVTEPNEEDTIDGQIDQFKALPEDKRKKLLDVLENRYKNPATGNAQQSLMFKILTMNLPTEVQSMVLGKYNSLQHQDPSSSEYFKHRNWLEKLTSLPLGIYKELPVKLDDGSEKCGAFMERARRCLDEAIYGQDEAKLQILQFIGSKITNPSARGMSLLLAGPPGIGKTSLIKTGIAKALEWPFQFISLGGDSDASTYVGHQLVYEGSHCGKIVNCLAAAKSMSMVLMFDELDKISTTPKGEEVQNLLVHMTDPVQNGDFEDKYLSGVPIDLSRVMFTFSANDLGKIDRVLMDRMIVIQLQGYSAKEKLAIAENYLLPAALKEVSLAEKVGISKDVIQHIIENYAKEESGVRELKRCIEQIAQKVNMLRMFNTKELPFHIKDFTLPFVMKKEHVDLFLKKKTVTDESARHMYT